MGMSPREIGEFELSAIDGEAKEPRNFREGSMGMGGTVYTPAEREVRSDVLQLLKKDRNDFLQWLEPRIEAVNEELERYELICSIPDLEFGAEKQKNDLTSNTGIRNHLEVLRKAKTYLNALKKKWEELHDEELKKHDSPEIGH